MNSSDRDGFMAREVKRLLDLAVQVLQDMEDCPAKDKEYFAGRKEVEGTITVLERTLKDLKQLARTYQKEVRA